ncbi:MAG: hypothetical protein HYU67_06485 [Flavobacteriia bacterium]|nr:hypothetical protein [Flavobacteriia bacterium]
MLEDKIAQLELIKEKITSLEKDSFNFDSANELENLCKNLYDWTIILKYKLCEQKVFKNETFELPDVNILDNNKLSVSETVVNPIEENNIDLFEQEKENVLSVEMEEKETIYDMDIFSTNEYQNVNFEEKVVSSAKSFVEEQSTIFALEIDEEEVEPIIETENLTSNQENEKDFIDELISEKIENNDDSLVGHFLQSKIELLEGAFSFNERFQYVQELFSGSNEEFNKAIKLFDDLYSFSEAKEVLLDYINLYEWDTDSELVKDFIIKLYRRFLK